MNPTILLDRAGCLIRYEPDAFGGMDVLEPKPHGWEFDDNISAETFAARVKSANRVFTETTWKPITGAPKDGTRFLAMDAAGNCRTMNQPNGYALGFWTVIDGSWRGGTIQFAPVQWCEHPEARR